MYKKKKLKLPFANPKKIKKESKDDDEENGDITSSTTSNDLQSSQSTVRLRALSSIESKGKAAVPAIVGMLANETNCQVKHQAVKILGILKDTRAYDTLLMIGHDSKVPYYIRNSALEAAKVCAPPNSILPQTNTPKPPLQQQTTTFSPPTTPHLVNKTDSPSKAPPVSTNSPSNPTLPSSQQSPVQFCTAATVLHSRISSPTKEHTPPNSPTKQYPPQVATQQGDISNHRPYSQTIPPSSSYRAPTQTPQSFPCNPQQQWPDPPNPYITHQYELSTTISKIAVPNPHDSSSSCKKSHSHIVNPTPYPSTNTNTFLPALKAAHISSSQVISPLSTKPLGTVPTSHISHNNNSNYYSNNSNSTSSNNTQLPPGSTPSTPVATPPGSSATTPNSNHSTPSSIGSSPSSDGTSPPSTSPSGPKSKTRKRTTPTKITTIDSYFAKKPKVEEEVIASQNPTPTTTSAVPPETQLPSTQQSQGGVSQMSSSVGLRPIMNQSFSMQNCAITTTQTTQAAQATAHSLSLPSSYSTRSFSSAEVVVTVAEPETKAPPKPRVAAIPLSDEQKAVVSLAVSGCSFFFTGRAGTGKSLVMREIVQQLRTIHGEQCVFVTASTGIAACSIGGTTVHAFAGVGLGEDSAQELARKACEKREFLTFTQSVNVTELRGKTPLSEHASYGLIVNTWESDFVGILDEVRLGKLSDRVLKMLEKCVNTVLSTDDGIQPTRLYPHKRTVDEENKKFLESLPGEKYIFNAEDSGNKSFAQQFTQPTVLELKLNAQVILIKNLDVEREQVNGARGVIIGWETPSEEEAKKFPNFKKFPIVKFVTGRTRTLTPEQWSIEQGGATLCSRTQIPLDLAWALSIHKSQGMTIDKLEVGLTNVFECGQAYVALSRATSLEKLRILGQFNRSVVKTNARVIEFYSNFQKP